MSASSSDRSAPPSAVALEKPPSLAQLLAVRPYRWLWSARTLNGLATQIQAIALAWQIYTVARQHGTINQAAFAVGMLGLATFLPMMVLTPIAGDAADRYDRRELMRASIVLELLTAVGFAVMTQMRLNTVWPIYLLAAAFGAARAFSSPASASLMPTLVSRELLPRAIVFSSAGGQFAQIAGPAIGGLLVAFSPTLAFSASAAIFLISAIALSSFRAPPSPGVSASRAVLIAEGLAYVWSNKVVLGAISLDLFAVLLGGATSLLPVFARDVLHVGPQGFGVLRAAPAIGALISGFLLSARPIKSKVGIKMFCAVAGYGLATVVFALSRSMTLSCVALAGVGAGDMISVFVRQSLVQIVTPNPMRGRVASVSFLFVGASNELGAFESGGVARFLGPVGSALFGGVGALVVTGMWAWLFPALRKANKLT